MMDPVTLAVLKGRLEQIADEMDATLFRSAFNPIIAEAHDASHGLYDPVSGETLVQGKSGLPVFVGAMAFAVKAVIDKTAESGGVQPGETWIFNDPYKVGPIFPILNWSVLFILKELFSAIWRRSGIGMMLEVMFPEITTLSPPKVSRKACTFPRYASSAMAR